MKSFKSFHMSNLLANFLILTLLSSSLTNCEIIKEKSGKVKKVDLEGIESKEIKNLNGSSLEDRENLYQDGRGLFNRKISGNAIVDRLLNYIRIGMKAAGVNQIKFQNIKLPYASTSIFISGNFKGVDTIERDGDFNIELSLIRKTKFIAGFKIKRLDGVLFVKANGKERQIDMTIENISIKAEFEVQIIKIPPQIKMTEFKLSAGDVKADYGNFGFGFGLIYAIGDKLGLVDKIKDTTLQAISLKIKDLFNSGILGISKLQLHGR